MIPVTAVHLAAPDGEGYIHRISAVHRAQITNVFFAFPAEQLPLPNSESARRELGRTLSREYQDKFSVTLLPVQITTKEKLLNGDGILLDVQAGAA